MEEIDGGQPAAGVALDEQLACLLRAAGDGDVAAFENFYTRTVRVVLPSVRRICGEAHCEDALADAYLQAWKTLPSFDPERGAALAWLKTIARSRALDRLRSERRLHTGREGEPLPEADTQPCPDPGPQEIAEARQVHARLQTALASLPARQRQLLGLAYDRDCSHSEISAMTGLTIGTVRHLLRQSYARLQDTMGGHGDTLSPP